MFCTPFINTGEKLDLPDESESAIRIPESTGSPMGEFLRFEITATNTGSENYPYATGAVKWQSGTEEDASPSQLGFKIYIDGASHSYYIPIGIHDSWGPGRPVSLITDLPRLDGVDIRLSQAVFKKRIFFPLDIYLAGKLLNLSPASAGELNNLLIPAYILIFIFLIVSGIYILFFDTPAKKGAMRAAKKAVSIFILSVLLFFSATYIYAEVLAVKSYWQAYRDEIISGDLESTYRGFYGFEKFISWAGEIVPEDKNILALVRGEPVYIMSEMAYNLYPRDIKFIDLSGRDYEEINDEIEEISQSYTDSYEYLIVLSEDDSYFAAGFELVARYRTTGGFIYSTR
jgi:hypothetical protein